MDPWTHEERRRVLVVMGDDLPIAEWARRMDVSQRTIQHDLEVVAYARAQVRLVQGCFQRLRGLYNVLDSLDIPPNYAGLPDTIHGVTDDT